MTDVSNYLRELAAGFVNGTLSPDDRKAVEDALPTDQALAAEIDGFRKIAAAIKSMDASDSDSDGTDSDGTGDFDATAFGWKRLQRDLGAQDQPAPQAAPGVTPLAGHTGPLRTATPANENTPFWRYAAALLGVVALGQAAFIALPEQDRRADVYVTAGATGPVDYAVKVAFRDDATMGAITVFLDDLDGSVVNGPGASGLYEVRFATSEKQADALVAMAERSDIVTIAAKG